LCHKHYTPEDALRDGRFAVYEARGSHRVRGHFQFYFTLAFLLVAAGNTAKATNTLQVEVFPRVVQQGDVCVIKASGPSSIKSIYGEFRGGRFFMSPGSREGTYEGLLGIDMNTRPAAYPIKVVAEEKNGIVYSSTVRLKVGKAKFLTETLSLPPSMVDLGPEALERVNREAARIRALFSSIRKERFWNGAFIRPVPGEVTGAFGVRRIVNGRPGSPHSGIDMRAEEGTPVLACNRGVVALVDELFFSGKSVILDHGGGMYSMYFHLSEALVQEGASVDTGAMLGRVGSTGRSTGPHLHWGIRLNGVQVNPVSVLQLSQHLREGSPRGLH
jgi:murein DD-endopeptidase MepM/ murein hydrolase activator NlpD